MAKAVSHKEPARPTKIVIGDMPWSVEWLDEEEWLSLNDLDPVVGDVATNDMRAYTHSVAYAIKMRTFIGRAETAASSISQLQATLFHEITHAVCHTVDWQFNADMDGQEVEERFISAVSPTLLSVIRSNPILHDWLMWREF